MKNTINILVLLVIFTTDFSFDVSAQVQDQKNHSVFSKIITTPNWVYLPPTYGEEEKQWPMILFLHGATCITHEHENLLRILFNLDNMQQLPELFDCVVISPQCPVGDWWDIPKLQSMKILT